MINKKGQTMPLAILGALGVFIVGLIFMNFLLPEINTFRVDMACSNVVSLTDGGKIMCLIGDATIPYAILAVISLAIGLIINRMRL